MVGEASYCSLKYEVTYTTERADDDFGPAEMADEIRAFYESARERGGRVIEAFSYDMDGDVLFFVAELPDDADTSQP